MRFPRPSQFFAVSAVKGFFGGKRIKPQTAEHAEHSTEGAEKFGREQSETLPLTATRALATTFR